MQLLDDRKLAKRFRDNAVCEKEQFLYFLAYMVLLSLATSTWIIFTLYDSVNHWDAAIDVLAVAYTLAGTIILFRTNARGDNLNFIARYVCLTIPVAVQTLLLLVILFAFVITGEAFAGLVVNWDDTTLLDFIIYVLTLSFFYVRLNGAIRLAAASPERI